MCVATLRIEMRVATLRRVKHVAKLRRDMRGNNIHSNDDSVFLTIQS